MGVAQHLAQLAAPAHGDAFTPVGFTAVVHTGSQASIAHQMFRGGKEGDIADNNKNRHCGQQAKAGQLHKVEDVLIPGSVMLKRLSSATTSLSCSAR